MSSLNDKLGKLALLVSTVGVLSFSSCDTPKDLATSSHSVIRVHTFVNTPFMHSNNFYANNLYWNYPSFYSYYGDFDGDGIRDRFDPDPFHFGPYIDTDGGGFVSFNDIFIGGSGWYSNYCGYGYSYNSPWYNPYFGNNWYWGNMNSHSNNLHYGPRWNGFNHTIPPSSPGVQPPRNRPSESGSSSRTIVVKPRHNNSGGADDIYFRRSEKIHHPSSEELNIKKNRKVVVTPSPTNNVRDRFQSDKKLEQMRRTTEQLPADKYRPRKKYVPLPNQHSTSSPYKSNSRPVKISPNRQSPHNLGTTPSKRTYNRVNTYNNNRSFHRPKSNSSSKSSSISPRRR